MTRKDFNKRFDITESVEEAQKRFINRVLNIFDQFGVDYPLKRHVWNFLGERYFSNESFEHLIKGDFNRCLMCLEAVNEILTGRYKPPFQPDSKIPFLLENSEIDLGVRWHEGKFIRSGARLLDDRLVNDPLHWLRDKKYKSVLKPYQKGLDHFLKSRKNPSLLSDVITDMYEALEALASIVTGKPNWDLSRARDLFIKKVKASNEYKNLLKEYIIYANKFRHAEEEGKPKPEVIPSEVESFIYMTGIFIRLTIGTP